jgi:hypothetical protein
LRSLSNVVRSRYNHPGTAQCGAGEVAGAASSYPMTEATPHPTGTHCAASAPLVAGPAHQSRQALPDHAPHVAGRLEAAGLIWEAGLTGSLPAWQSRGWPVRPAFCPKRAARHRPRSPPSRPTRSMWPCGSVPTPARALGPGVPALLATPRPATPDHLTCPSQPHQQKEHPDRRTGARAATRAAATPTTRDKRPSRNGRPGIKTL